MYSLAVINAINNRNEVAAVKAAAEPVKKENRKWPVKVEEGRIIVESEDNRHGIDGTVLYVSKSPNSRGNYDESEYYLNRTAGFQRYHDSYATRVEVFGLCKQVGVTEKEFLKAFPWNYKRPDPIKNIKVPKIECEECGDKVDIEYSVFEDATNLCEDCYCSGTCGHCGEYYGRDNLTYDGCSDYCGHCKENVA